jgi:hypothetical protein
MSNGTILLVASSADSFELRTGKVVPASHVRSRTLSARTPAIAWSRGTGRDPATDGGSAGFVAGVDDDQRRTSDHRAIVA